jgi:hypothetical protein
MRNRINLRRQLLQTSARLLRPEFFRGRTGFWALGKKDRKTKRPKNKTSEKQNVRKTKCPKNKMFKNQNVRKTKCPKKWPENK